MKLGDDCLPVNVLGMSFAEEMGNRTESGSMYVSIILDVVVVLPSSR